MALSKIQLICDKVINRLILKKNRISYGRNLKINGAIRFQGIGSNLSIGDNVVINSGWRFNVTGGCERTGIAIYGGKIKIGDNVGISNTNIVSMISITIEDDVIIGAGTRIMDSDFHSLQYINRMQSKDTHINSKPVIIKKGAFIGAYSIILKGVTVGEKSVIAAGSVVTKDVPKNEIWGGNPAKFIRNVD